MKPLLTLWLFQFHYGTIKRKDMQAKISIQIAFQFHYGTIKSFDS